MNTLYQGEDKTIQFDLKDAAGNPVTFASLLEVLVNLTVDNYLILAASKTVQANKVRVQSVSGQSTRCKVILPAAVTAGLWPNRIVKVEIKTYTTDADYQNGRAEITQATLYKVKASSN